MIPVVEMLTLPNSPESVPPPYVESDAARWAPEAPKRRGRTAFERDRARMVHSSAMRRLGAKTQVLTPGTDDYSRTRLTHSLEVAQIGREMGRALGADPDLVDTACLAHDIGHPPFGHNGESALAEAAAGIGGFEGNAQTLRILTRLEPKVQFPDGTAAGLNLTRASLDACVKYPWRWDERPTWPDGSRSPKFGVYEDDAPVFEWLKANSGAGLRPRQKPVEAQIMDFADDVAYSVHDVEDAVVARRVDFESLTDPDTVWQIVVNLQSWYGDYYDGDELSAAIARLQRAGLLRGGFDGSRQALAALKDATSSLIGRFSGTVQSATRGQYGGGPLTRYGAELIIPADTKMEIMVLKGIAITFVMFPRSQEPSYANQREVLHELVAALAQTAPANLEPDFADDWAAAADDAARLRVVIDQVATLTDLRALAWHRALQAGQLPQSG